jgi:hypothetical protein
MQLAHARPFSCTRQELYKTELLAHAAFRGDKQEARWKVRGQEGDKGGVFRWREGERSGGERVTEMLRDGMEILARTHTVVSQLTCVCVCVCVCV